MKSNEIGSIPCPHCGEPCFTTPAHMCADKDRWTSAERDAWHALCARYAPWMRFAPSTQWMADHFGDRSAR